MTAKLPRNLTNNLNKILHENDWDNLFILVDSNTKQHCLPKLLQSERINSAKIITIAEGEENKTIETVLYIWEFLHKNNATRSSCLINLGGGIVTDIGGFAASTFKRGMDYINIPTTLLSMVDAATGGKTGFNFQGLKNEIGTFSSAKEVLLDMEFLKTQDEQNLFSGFAEMVKHALIDGRESWSKILDFDLNNIDFDILKVLIDESIDIKEKIIIQDPTEKGIRKALNLGHTFGHAFESLSYIVNKPLLHGYAVMYGLLGELYLSRIRFNFPKDDIFRLKQLINEYYGTFPFNCKQYEKLGELMTHDKKNRTQEINFTLLSNIGEFHINQTGTKDEIYECFDYLREG